jgi:hypothetical protein
MSTRRWHEVTEYLAPTRSQVLPRLAYLTLMAWVSSKQVSSWSRVWEDPSRKCPPGREIRQLLQAPFSQVRGPFS